MIDALVYARLIAHAPLLALVPIEQINPVRPEPDSPQTELYYGLIATDESLTLSGPTGTMKFTYSFDATDVDPSTVNAILDAVYAAFLGWHTSPVQACFQESRVLIPEEETGCFHGQIVFGIWHGLA